MSKKKEYRPIPPDEALPGFDGEIWQRPRIDALILAVDPAERSGFCILESRVAGGRIIDYGDHEISGSRGPENAVEMAVDHARFSKIPLLMVCEHSKNAHQKSGFGISGFIGMMRAQGVWLRTWNVILSEQISGGQFKVGRRNGLKPTRRQLITPNDWRTGVFGTLRYKDGKKTYSLQRPHWKYLARKAVSRRWPEMEDVSEDAAEAVLIGLWATRMGRM